MSDPDAVARWFYEERGITRETLRAFNVHVVGGMVQFEYPNGTKERPDPTQPLKDGQRRFYFTQGKTPDLYRGPLGDPSSTVAYLVEGESDTLRLWQETGGKGPVYGLSGINTWHEGLAEQLAGYDRVYCILDNDADYMVRAQVDAAWRKIRNDLHGKAKRIHLPNDVKDICEFFSRYDMETLMMLQQRMGVSRYTPIDFNTPPPPVKWLLDGYIAMGDVTLLVGLGGVGKSFVASGLAVAVLSGQDRFLGQKVEEHGNVLYVDEENPLDVVYKRTLALGFRPSEHSGAMRYLWNTGLALDRPRDSDQLLDEGLDYRPKLIVLDSLTRLHSKEENVAGEIAPLFNEAIKPLARQTGAGVVLIHHHDKNANGPRGSTDIRNSADAVIEVYEYSASNPGKFRLKLTKSRRKLGGSELVVGIQDNPDGSISLQVDPVLEPMF